MQLQQMMKASENAEEDIDSKYQSKKCYTVFGNYSFSNISLNAIMQLVADSLWFQKEVSLDGRHNLLTSEKPYTFVNLSPNVLITMFKSSAYSNVLAATFAKKRRSQQETMNTLINDLYDQYYKLNAQLKEEKKRRKGIEAKDHEFTALLDDLKIKLASVESLRCGFI
ncbi:uncharacterized protein G2W53_014066 [Senna tora]|uniref:Uncharacterized protein n=1 Tax=Senna tora TaxID=362788 RepID=A0A834TZU0_9FABA|nr:uncharacterized protein G2W53_014066 [Senna tora]